MTEQLAWATDAGPVRFPAGDDLGRSRGTDFYLAEERLRSGSPFVKGRKLIVRYAPQPEVASAAVHTSAPAR